MDRNTRNKPISRSASKSRQSTKSVLGQRKPIDRRWLAMIVICLGTLMIVLDTTIVNVALPSIQKDLGFSAASLAWVVNAYMLMFGGFLLLGGRLGDLFGHRRLFLVGLSVFTGASLACGLSAFQLILIIARAIQGMGGAVVSAVGLSLIMTLFTQPAERAKAMGIFGFVAGGGGAVGVLLGGILTGALSWHWIFLVNIPLGILVFILSLHLLPKSRSTGAAHHIDFFGAITITGSILLAVYAVVNGSVVGWLSRQTLGMFAAAAILLICFVFVESKVKHPLMPLRLLRLRNVVIANIMGILWAAAMFAWFFLSALYMGLVLGYTPLQVGLSFLPANIIMAIMSIGLSAWLVNRFGIKRIASIGMFFVAVGLLLFARAPLSGHFFIDVLPSMILLGIGAGVALNPVLLAAMNDVPSHESGLASGMVNTSFMLGGALGLAILASIAALRAQQLIALGQQQVIALNSGYHIAFFVGALSALVASALGLFALRVKWTATSEKHVHVH